MEHNVWDLFTRVAEAVAERPAIADRNRRLSYAQLADRATRFGSFLASQGLGCREERDGLRDWESGQDMVGLYLHNCTEYMEATLGAFASRTAPFNVNYRYIADELAYLLDDAKTAALVFHSRFAPILASVLPRLDRTPLLIQVADGSGEAMLPGAVDYEEILAAATPSVDGIDRSPDDLYVLYTGGTTGMPKGTLWRQADAYMVCFNGDLHGPDATADTIVSAAAASESTRLVPNAPFMHGAAHWLALRQFLTGGAVVVNRVVDRFDPVDMWSLIDEEKGNATLFIGEAFARPAMDAFEAGSFDGSTLAMVVCGGAITTPETKERILAALPHVVIIDTAGASETGGALSRISTAGSAGALAIFQPRAGSAVLDSERTRQLQAGEPEIGWFATGGRIPLGYLGDATKTAATFSAIGGQRWSVPGDRARLLADGSVELLGRDSVTINSGGEKIFAEEVEQAILTHPSVRDAVVVGRPSERWGQEVVAIVSLRADAVDADLLDAAAQRIARFKLPKAIIRVDEVVRSPAGKADYRWARDIATR